MPNGYRSLGIAALAAALLIAFGLGSFWTALPYPQERYQPYQDSKSNEGGSPTTVANVAKSVMQRTPCQNPQSETESDLCAQWRAAKAAEKSADWTLYGVVASAIGISLLLWQIMLTREAVKDTGDATVAMKESNRIAESARRSSDSHARTAIQSAKFEARRAQSNAERQLRAYITVTDVKIEIDPNNPSKILATAHFANQGETPAIYLQSGLYISVTHGSKVPDTFVDHDLNVGSKMIIEKGGAREISHSSFITAVPYIVMTGDYTVCAYGWLRYNDIFGKPHETRHCHFTNSVSRGAGRYIAAAHVGNTMT